MKSTEQAVLDALTTAATAAKEADKKVRFCLARVNDALIELVGALEEVEKGQHYLPLGFHMFEDYLFARTGHGRSWYELRKKEAAVRAEVPLLEKAIQSGELHNRTIRALLPIIDNDNAAELIRKTRGKPFRNVKTQIAEYKADNGIGGHGGTAHPLHRVVFSLTKTDARQWHRALGAASKITDSPKLHANLRLVLSLALQVIAEKHPEIDPAECEGLGEGLWESNAITDQAAQTAPSIL